ncbi:MAG TPA: helix-turn-helix transcriptional regulator [Bryobacterales bacterium]|nr:helix-turn-helix transcriptional regulator [Bryobacterales bacterium]
MLRNCTESKRLARVIADFLPEVLVCAQSGAQPPGLNEPRAAAKRAFEAGAYGHISVEPACPAAQDARRPSPRDRTVLLLVYRGLTNKEIAQHLGVSTRTVKGYLSQLFAVFDVSNRTELVGVAADLGLVGTAPGGPAR